MSLSPLKYHSNSGPTSSCSSATYPSTDTTACITTVPTLPPSRRICSLRLTTADLDSHRSTDRQTGSDLHDVSRLPVGLEGAGLGSRSALSQRLPIRNEGIVTGGQPPRVRRTHVDHIS